jgi:small conductance mechanosensitive channel
MQFSLATGATPPAITAPETVQQAVGIAPDRIVQLVETYGIPVVKAIVILIVGWIVAGWLSKLASTACRKANLDETLARFLGNIVRWFVIAAVVITCLASFGVQVASLVAILGSVGVAIGLALQGSLSHIASGVMLLIFRPFKVGDFVTAGGQTGIINEIGLFSTTLDTADNRRIIVPNGAIVSGVITNATFHPARVADVTVQVDAGVSVEAARLVLSQAAAGVEGRDASKAPAVALGSMGATNAFNVAIWCKTGELDAVKERLLIALNAAIANKGMGPAAPVTLVKNV